MSDKIKMTIWGRELELGITFDCYSNEEVDKIQLDALNAFVKSVSSIDEALDEVKSYCLANNQDEIGDDTIENIFKYVSPKYLYVAKDKKHTVAIMCNYRFDQENGIAIVFEDEKFIKIGKQDIIL